ELTFLWLKVKLVFLKSFHHQYNHPTMFNYTFHDQISEDIIHYGLKGCWTVGESKEHD
ncbi:hypothetical protein M422DRAFT_182136, partial [Sphaerobolus stellatus SS14]